jgi:hypothetical protein
MPTLFDERTKLYGEEFLFAVDTLLAGHFMAYTPEIRILHEEGVSTGSLPSATKMRLGYENAALAAGLAAGELDNFAAACRGEPLDCRSESLVTLVAGPRRHVLVDLFFCQPGYHGGGEYGKAVFRGLAGAAAARSDVTIWAALDPALHIDPWVLAECRRVLRPGGWLHVVSEDYGMLQFPPRDGVDPDRLWTGAVVEHTRLTGTDARIGRRTLPMLRALGFMHVSIQYLVLDTERVPREVLAGIIESWRDGYAPVLAASSGMALSAVTALFDASIATLRDPDGYAVWQLPVVAGRQPGVAA